MTLENAPTETETADVLALFERARIALRQTFEISDSPSGPVSGRDPVGSTPIAN